MSLSMAMTAAIMIMSFKIAEKSTEMFPNSSTLNTFVKIPTGTVIPRITRQRIRPISLEPFFFICIPFLFFFWVIINYYKLIALFRQERSMRQKGISCRCYNDV